MISKQNRFVGNKPIERIYKSAKPVRLGPFNIRVKTSQIEGYRLAVVVSKKVSKSAVVRNRIRRRLFEYIRKNLGEKLNGKEIIITVFDESTATEKSENLGQGIQKLFEKAGVK